MNLSNILLISSSSVGSYPKGWSIVLPIMIVVTILKIVLDSFDFKEYNKWRRNNKMKLGVIEKDGLIDSENSILSIRFKKKINIVGKFILVSTTVILLYLLYLVITCKNQLYEMKDKNYYIIPWFGFIFVYYYVIMSLMYLKTPKEFSTLQNILNKICGLSLLFNGSFWIILFVSPIYSIFFSEIPIHSTLLSLIIYIPLFLYGLSLYYYLFKIDKFIYEQRKKWYRLEVKIFSILITISVFLFLVMFLSHK